VLEVPDPDPVDMKNLLLDLLAALQACALFVLALAGAAIVLWIWFVWCASL
jgi:hypothetical protein